MTAALGLPRYWYGWHIEPNREDLCIVRWRLVACWNGYFCAWCNIFISSLAVICSESKPGDSSADFALKSAAICLTKYYQIAMVYILML